MTYFIQIDDEVREATSQEVEAIEKSQAQSAKIEAEQKAKAATRAAALAKLGLTADEIAALFG